MPPEPPHSAHAESGTLLARVVVPESQGGEVRLLYQDRDGSFASYFNAFPAAYWRRWTALSSVQLRIRTEGAGSARVWSSDAEGTAREVMFRQLEAAPAESAFDLPLAPFDDGGWYWFDLDGASFVDGGWWAIEPAVRRCRPSIGITTLNREEFLLPVLRTIVADRDVMNLIDRIFVIDHGSRRVADAADFDVVEAAFGGKLALIEQANIGGSGGFSRSMLEALDTGSDAVILLDDDVAIDPESIRRMIPFEEFVTQPVVVRGHMFDMYRPSQLLALSEGFRMDRFLWQVQGPSRQDIAAGGLRGTSWLHRRGDAQYNGWWMCLIPVEVLRSAGLSLPFFIKWDDAEYGLRAAEHGYPTVTLPGAAIWHVSWQDKDDTVDWQAYYHSRNRTVTALLHSPLPRGGKAMQDEFLVSLKNLFAFEYGAQALRNEAYRDVLAGPDGMHEALATRLPEVRAILRSHSSGQSIPNANAPVSMGPVPQGVESLLADTPRGITTARQALPLALRNVLRSTRGVGERPPQGKLPFERTKWWISGRFDSVLVAAADETSVRWLRRDRRLFLQLLRDAWRLTRRIRREWPRLAAEYQAATPDLVSVERWRETTSAPVTGSALRPRNSDPSEGQRSG